MPRPPTDPRFPALLRELLARRGLSYRALALRTYYGKSYLHDLATGRKAPTVQTARRLDAELDAGGELAALAATTGPAVDPDETDALELARRVSASDLSAETLTRLEDAFDDLAMAYVATEPEELLPQVREQLGFVSRLLDARKTLDQQRRLLVVGGWLSLLAATVHIDQRRQGAAEARLRTASQLAEHTGHTEIQGWCLETRAWAAVTAGDYPRTVDLAQQAQQVAPRGSSAHIQATAQEGRAWARMGDQRQTRAVLDRVDRLVSSLPRPERPEHHYRYDPDKARWYTAATLAWARDPAAEEITRSVIAMLEREDDGVHRPRRVATARLDLSLALLAADQPDEATAHALTAITSGWVVPSNWWRAAEVLSGVEDSEIRDSVELRDAYETHRPTEVPRRSGDGGQR